MAWTLLRRDPFVLAVLALLVFEALAGGGSRFTRPLALTLVLAAVWRGRARVIDRQERPFWSELAGAFGFWWLTVLLQTFFPDRSLIVQLTGDMLLALAYVFLVLAVERQPHHRSRWRPTRLEQMLSWPAVALFVLGLFLYFVLIPLLVDRSVFAAGDPAATFAVALDGYLLIQLLFLGTITQPPRWRAIYRLLALMMTGWLIGDLARLPAMAGARALPAWSLLGAALAYLGALFAVRGRELRFPRRRGDQPEHEPASDLRATTHTLVAALAFPVIHTVGYATAWLEPASRSPRELLVFAWLFLLGAIALIQHRLLRRKTGELWRERTRVEKALHKSEQDLRLTIARRTAAEAIRASQDRFAKVFRTCPSSMVISRLHDGRILEINESFERMTGYGAGEVIGRTAEQLGLWRRSEDRDDLLEALRSEGVVRNHPYRFRHKDGRKRMMLIDATEVGLDGERCLLSLARDVTETFRQTAAAPPDAAVVLDAAGRIVHWSEDAGRLYGWRRDEALGRSARALLAPVDDRIWPRAQRAVETEGEWRGELLQRTRDGALLRIAKRWVLIRDARRRPYLQLLINSDAALGAEPGGS